MHIPVLNLIILKKESFLKSLFLLDDEYEFMVVSIMYLHTLYIVLHQKFMLMESKTKMDSHTLLSFLKIKLKAY